MVTQFYKGAPNWGNHMCSVVKARILQVVGHNTRASSKKAKMFIAKGLFCFVKNLTIFGNKFLICLNTRVPYVGWPLHKDSLSACVGILHVGWP